MGIPATGRQVKVEEVVVMRIAGGKVVEGWGVFDGLTMMRQLGAIPAPGQGGS